MSTVKKIIYALLLSGFAGSNTLAGELDMLIKKLAEKNVISYGEASQIMTESTEQIRAEMASGKYEGAPKWTQALAFKGDMRLRHQSEKLDTGLRRDRSRLRFRLGLTANVSPGFSASAGLCTGSSDPRSTNQTFENNFATKSIMLDYAYITYSPASFLNIYGGKFGISNALWTASDLLFDSDLTPEGLNANYKITKNKYDFFANAGYYILDEVSTSADVMEGNSTTFSKDSGDPYMYIVQAGVTYNINENTKVKAAPVQYGFGRIKDYLYGNARFVDASQTNTSKSTSTTTTTKFYQYDYTSTGADVEVSFPLPFAKIPAGKVFGSYISNPDPENENKGYLGGLKIGSPKISAFGDWDASYMYRQLEKDAFLDCFPDSDAYSGKTDYLGHEVIFTVGLAKNVSLGFDYYETRPKTGSELNNGQKTQKLLQTDLVVKF